MLFQYPIEYAKEISNASPGPAVGICPHDVIFFSIANMSGPISPGKGANIPLLSPLSIAIPICFHFRIFFKFIGGLAHIMPMEGTSNLLRL